MPIQLLKKHHTMCGMAASRVPRGNPTPCRCWNIAGAVRGGPAPHVRRSKVDSSAGRHSRPKTLESAAHLFPPAAASQARRGVFAFNLLIFIDIEANSILRVHRDGASRAWDPVVPILGQITYNPAFSCGCQSVASGILRPDRRRPCFVPDAHYPRVLIFRMSKRHAYSSSGRAACDQVTGSKVRWARETTSP